MSNFNDDNGGFLLDARNNEPRELNHVEGGGGTMMKPKSQSPSQSQFQSQSQPQRSCNAELTEAEKIIKRDLKKKLKQQNKLRKYQTRLQQALDRGDIKTAERARREIQEYHQLHDDESSSGMMPQKSDSKQSKTPLSPLTLSPATLVEETERIRQGRKWIKSLYETLIQRILQKQHEQQQQQEQQEVSCSNTIATKNLLPSSASAPSTPASPPQNNAAAVVKRRSSNKFFQTTQARVLLHHMDKGTQTEGMFQNQDALMGYTRQKFVERAMLSVSSLERLFVLPIPNTPTEKLSNHLWTVKTICSIGCGPGCDAVGVLAFLDLLCCNDKDEDDGSPTPPPSPPPPPPNKTEEETTTSITTSTPQRQRPLLKSLILMDYVMPQWKDAILDELTNTSLIGQNLVEQVFMASCDIRCSLLNDEVNISALEAITGGGKAAGSRSGSITNPVGTDGTDISIPSDTTSSLMVVDLVVVSYVLTETRGKWHAFFHDLIVEGYNTENDTDTDKEHDNGNDNVDGPLAPPPLPPPCQMPLLRSGTLILMSEPTAWQLHHWLDLVRERLSDYEWLDSSRLSPELQGLEGRIGPAVLLARVK